MRMNELSSHDAPDVLSSESSAAAVGLLKSVLSSLTREIDRRLVPHDLTDAQWIPLLMISKRGCSTATEIARQSYCDAGAITRTLTRLEEKSLVTRVRSDSDRRVVTVQLTHSGAQAAARVPAVIAEVLNLYLCGFDETEFRVILDLLTRMKKNGETDPSPTPPASPAASATGQQA